MTSEILRMAYRERELLQAELQKHPSWIKIQQIQRLIDTYESLEGALDEATPPMVKPLSFQPIEQLSKVAAVDKAVTEYLEKTGVRASSGHLLPVIQKAGVEMTGKVPTKTLASFLSNSKRFNNLKGYGYGLIEWGESPQKPDKIKPPQLDNRSSSQELKELPD